MKIVGLTGLPRCGKDTLANLMVARHGWIKLAYATALYEEVALSFGVTVQQLQSDEWKSTPQTELMPFGCDDFDFQARFGELYGDGECLQAQTSRRILQVWGTEYRRHQQITYWTDRLLERLRVLYDAGAKRVVVSDVRVNSDGNGITSYNEFYCLDEFANSVGGSMRLGEIVREGTVDTGHISDKRFPDHLIYTQLKNDRSPETLFFQAGKQGLLV